MDEAVNDTISLVNYVISSNSNEILYDIIQQLQNIINNLKENKNIENAPNQLENIITSLNKIITDNNSNTKKLENVIRDIYNMNKNISELKQLLNFNNITSLKNIRKIFIFFYIINFIFYKFFK